MDDKILKILNIITVIIILIPILFYGLNFLSTKTSQALDSVSICKLSLNPWSRNSCYRQLLIRTDKIKVCDNLPFIHNGVTSGVGDISEDKFLCYRHVAKKVNDESICDRIPKEDKQNQYCHEDFGGIN